MSPSPKSGSGSPCFVRCQLLHLGCNVGELVQCGVDPDEGELTLDDCEVGAPDVGEDATQVCRRVVPALAGVPAP
jgi:hypothetical protein